MNPAELSEDKQMAIALASGLGMSTIRRWVRGVRVRSTTEKRISGALVQLGLVTEPKS